LQFSHRRKRIKARAEGKKENKMIKQIITFLISLVISNGICNDSYLGTQGGTIYPQKSNSISMVKENVSIILSRTGGNVYCKFWLLNKGNDDTVIVGFPDKKINPAGYNESAQSFVTYVNGKQVSVRRDSLLEFYTGDTIKESWYYWKVHFPTNDTVFIENKYSGLWGGSYCEKKFEYIIGTGNKWAEPIGHGRIVFHHGNLLSTLFIGKSILKDTNDLKPTYYTDSTVYEFSNYTPKDHETVDLWFSSYWDNLKGQKCPGFYIRPDTLKFKREMVNELFARCGNVFTNKELQGYYLKQAWYKPIGKLTLEELPINIKTYIINLKAEE
jgi:hypothetical protein